MNNILDLLVEYSKNRKLIDIDFITKVVKEKVEELELEDYVKKIKTSGFHYQNIINKQTTSIGYDYYKKAIAVDEKELNNDIKFLTGGDFSEYSEFEKYLRVNSYILEILLHEIELANQFKKTSSDNCEFEQELLRICLHVYKNYLNQPIVSKFIGYYFRIWIDHDTGIDIENYRRITEQFPDILPNERIAGIKSNKNIQEILRPISTQIPHVYEYFRKTLIEKELKGYDFNKKITSPTERFLDEYKGLYLLGSEEYFNNGFYSLMHREKVESLENRFKFGLDISEKDYNEHKKELSRK